MAKAPVILLVGSEYPHDHEAAKMIQSWGDVARSSLLKNDPWWNDRYTYNALKENHEYSRVTINIWTYPNLDSLDKSNAHPNRVAYRKERDTMFIKYGAIWVWRAAYELKISFRSGAVFSPPGKKALVVNESLVVLLLAHTLTPFLQDKYEEWLLKWGYDAFIPMFMKLPGVKGYDVYKNIPNRPETELAREKEYPPYLTIIYFDGEGAYESYRKSPELAAFQRVMQADFSGALSTKWDLPCKLTNIFRREE